MMHGCKIRTGTVIIPMKSSRKRTHYLLLLLLASALLPQSLYSQVYINEILASNATVNADPDYGNYCDWTELHNASGQGVDLGGYYLSDNADNLSMWKFRPGTVIPAHGYLLVFADGSGSADGTGPSGQTGVDLHTNFKLAKEGETLYLVNATYGIIDSIAYPYQLTDISYGREADDAQARGYFESPTPGSANPAQSVPGISPDPVFSIQGGFHAEPVTVGISTAHPAAQVHYTLNGTEPTENSPAYTTPLIFGQTTVLRVKTFEEGMLPGLARTQSYFIDEPQNLPVISLVTDPDHFFSDETGIYVIGTAGVEGYCTSVPHNVNRDWERPVNIEMFEMDGSVGLNQVAGVKIFGGCSRVRYPQKSLAFYARKEYETASFKYRLFPDKSSEEYETFILRASADDQPFTLFRDPLTQMLVKDVIDVDVQAYRPVVVYINGEYWGIHNLREKINEHYAEDNFGVNPDSVDMLKRNPEDSWNVVYGSADRYNAMMDYLRQNDITLPEHYNYIKTQMDVDEYINYQIVEIFFGGRDWPGNNIKFWRSHEPPYDRWRWVLYDLDHMFKEYFSDIMEEATEVDCGCTWPNPPWSTYLFRRLLENGEFRNEFIQRFSIYTSTLFSRERIHAFIDTMQAVLAPEIPRHIERWGGQKTDLPDNTWVTPVFSTVEQWESNVQVMREFTDTRHEMALKHVMDYFGISGLANLKTSLDPPGTGAIRIGNTLLGEPDFSADFSRGEVLSLATVPDKGYLHSHWQVEHRTSADIVLIDKGDEWKYTVSRDLPAGDWISPAYDDSNWETGMAQLGYGDGDEATVVGYGGDSQDKFPTTWFRKKFSITDPVPFDRYTLHLLRDDGARVFLNGTEVIRDQLNRYWVGASSFAEATVQGSDESVYTTYYLNPALFHTGENIVAVEIHQASATSSDISFDMDLVATRLSGGPQELVNGNSLVTEIFENTGVTAFLVPDTNLVQGVFINELMARNDAAYADEAGEYEDWIELYNAGKEPVDLGGLYLADSLLSGSPWEFPQGHPETTTILPDSFILVFADNDREQGTLHADFRLSGDGEEVVLLQKSGEDLLIIDRVPFGTQYSNISYGRYPDGSASFEFMPVFTPLASNYLEFADTTEVTDTTGTTEPADTTGITNTVDNTYSSGQGSACDLAVYPVPTDGDLFIRFTGDIAGRDIPVDIEVSSVTGSVISRTLHRSSETIRLSLGDESPGLYFIHIRTAENIVVRRILLY
jgi:hypothetical protein